LTSDEEARGHEALYEWHLEEIDSSHRSMAAAISLAKELNDMHAFTHLLWNAGFLAHFERNPIRVERCASELIELSTSQNFASWLAQKHLEDQARRTGGKHYGHNIPFQADHSCECDNADEDGEPIDRSRAWKDYVQAEPDRQI
jgi:hypothetical protein